jgi:hypothetical protein
MIAFAVDQINEPNISYSAYAFPISWNENLSTFRNHVRHAATPTSRASSIVARCCMDPVLVAGERAGTPIGKPIHLPGTFAVPFKYHTEHRHRIPKARYRVTNWSEYDASLRQRAA